MSFAVGMLVLGAALGAVSEPADPLDDNAWQDAALDVDVGQRVERGHGVRV